MVSLLYKMTDSLWLGLGDHLSTILLQILSMWFSNSEVDSLQIVENTAMAVVVVAIVLWIYQKLKEKLIINPFYYN